MRTPRHEYPSVTEILEPYINFDMVPKAILEAAKARGSAVHAICAGYAQYGMAVNVPKQYIGYLNSFRYLFNGIQEIVIVEKRIVNHVLRVTGQPDLVVVLKGESLPRVIDLKTPAAAYKTWRTQAAAYKFLVEHELEILTDVPAHVRLMEDGSKPKVSWIDNHAEELERFMSALTLFHHYA